MTSKNNTTLMECPEVALMECREAALMECIGILGLADILYFYVNGAKNIRIDTPCSPECMSIYGREILEDELAELLALGEYFEFLNGVEIIADEAGVLINFPKQFPIAPSVDPKEEKATKQAVETTRRGMFNLFKDSAADTIIRSATMLTPQELPERTPPRDSKTIPEKRKIFIEALLSCGKILKDEIPTGAYFYNMAFSEECNFCKVCVRLCPTGALSVGIKPEVEPTGLNNGNVITFTPAICTSCGMCKISCYYKIITPQATLSLKDFFGDIIKAEKRN
jgi:ferredoxin